jgi:hypothetical protein
MQMADEPVTAKPASAVPTKAPAAVAPAPNTSTFLADLGRGDRKTGEIVVYHHSTLFYWWPVWALGFLLGIISFVSGWRMATVPAGTEAVQASKVVTQSKDYKDVEVLVLPSDEKHPGPKLPDRPTKLRTYPGKNLGVLFATVLLLVLVFTNIPLRGMWSWMVIFLVIALTIIFALADWWGYILTTFSLLDIRINAGGYFYISGILFGIWLFTTMFFDKQIYMVFTPGQFKVCTEVGGGEQVYSTVGMTLEKQRSDLFRHWILGLGSGDLIVKTTGAQAHHFEMSNVLFVGRKVQQIEDMVRQIPDR